MAKSRPAVPTPARQDEQRRLLEQARREPGVADALEAYGRLAGVADAFRREVTTIRFSTGGNYPTDHPTT
jgi:hypothetical protein